MTGPDITPGMSTDSQRYRIFELFTAAGTTSLQEMKAAAATILHLDGLTDLRELRWAQAEMVISVLVTSSAQRKVGGE